MTVHGPEAHAALRRWRTPAVASGLVALGGTAWMALLLAHSYFFVDDFLALLTASRVPRLTTSYLTMSVFGHLVPGWRLAFWLLWHTVGLDYRPVIVVTAVVQGLTLVALHRVVSALTARRWVAPVVCLVYAASPALVETEFWLANALHVMPSVCLTLWALEGFVRFSLHGRRRALAYSLPAAWAALAFYEKPVLLLLMAPALLVVVAIDRQGVRRGVVTAGRRLVRLAPLLAAYAAPMVAWFAYFFSNGYGSPGQRVLLGTLLRAEGRAWFAGIGPTLVGGPYRFGGAPGLKIGNPTTMVQLAGAVVALACVVVTCRRSPRALAAWAWAALGFATSFAVVAAGRLSAGATVIGLDFRYTADALPWVLIGAAVAVGGTDPGTAWPQGPERQAPVAAGSSFGAEAVRRPARGLAVAAAALVALDVIGGVVNALTYRAQWDAAVPAAYVAHASAGLRSLQERGQPFSVLDSQAPPSMGLLQLFPYDTTAALLPLTAPHLVFDDGTLPLYAVDERSGHVERAHVRPLVDTDDAASVEVSPASGCTPRGGGAVTYTFAAPLPFGVYDLDYHLTASAPTSVIVSVGTDAGPRFGLADPVPAPAGPSGHIALLAPQAAATRSLELVVPPGSAVCFGQVLIGVPQAGA